MKGFLTNNFIKMSFKQKLVYIKLWVERFVEYFIQNQIETPDISGSISNQIFIYQGDIKSTRDFIVSSVVRNSGSIIAARCGGKVVEIKDGIETELLFVEGSTDWRGLWKDSKGNIFISPHSTPILGTVKVEDRGIYKLSSVSSRFVKVLDFYNPKSEIKSETIFNDDTVWTFCEDDTGAIYAGIYAHTVRNNPAIYKSVNNGDSWERIYNFNESGLTQNARHIHSIVYSKTDSSLYALVGEINNLYKSNDGGYTWSALNIKTELAKGCTMLPVEDGIVIGSDSAYDCVMSKYYFKSKSVKTKSRSFGETIFSIRQSDKTGWIYAFGKVDNAVKLPTYYPPLNAENDIVLFKQWKKQYPIAYINWYFYHKRMIAKYPDDAFLPQHCAVLLSKDNGETWSIIKKVKTSSLGPNGFWTTGFFYEGKCLTGFVDGTIKYSNPFIIQEIYANIK